MVAMQGYERSPASLRAAVGRLSEQSGYDAVLIADGSRIAATAAPLIRSGPSSEARILGTELWNTDAALGGSAAMRGAWFASVSDGLYSQLATKYRTRFGRDGLAERALAVQQVTATGVETVSPAPEGF